mmetsp:Transcript_134780/g.430712  ORF Transcript_134780/g.430712 Transcript_134780/m.430712 type:complete len:95 (-) Transcript_134780:22-306(-)
MPPLLCNLMRSPIVSSRIPLVVLGSPREPSMAAFGRLPGQVVVALPMVDLSSGNDSDFGGGDLEGEDGDEDAITPGRPKKEGGQERSEALTSEP